jgi:SagB-type dehydrogenase family enzyme
MTGVHVTPRALTVLVYPDGGEPDVDDLAERYHESAKTSRHTIGREWAAMATLEVDAILRELVRGAVRRHAHRRAVPLPTPVPIGAGFTSLLEKRRSGREFDQAAIALTDLATVLHCGYGTFSRDATIRRTVPSGGGLYPLELYPIVSRVEGLEKGIYHYDPLRHALEALELRDLDRNVADLHVYPELAAAGVLLAVTGVFGRSRFKYGLRGYRFTLLEAGHALQNVLLAATALRLGAIPVAGVDDRSLERLLHVDGVDESVVCCAAIGRAPQTA